MNLYCFSLTAPLTNATGSFHDSFSCTLPTNTVATGGSAFPSGVGILYDKFRLPLSHATIITKNLIGMEVACRPCYWLTAPIAWLCDKVGTPRILFPFFAFLCALPRAIYLVSLTGAYCGFSTHRANINFSITPPILKVAIGRTKKLIGATIIRMKGFSAIFTYSGFAKFFHIYIINTIARKSIEIEEKYCEIAVNRLRQEVIPFN